MILNRHNAMDAIRESWIQLYKADKKGGIICPLCGSGSGKNGSGITSNSKMGKPYSLKCWKCGFQGDVIDLYQQEKGLSFNDALAELSNTLGIEIDNHRTDRTDRPEPIKPQAAAEPPADHSEYYDKVRNNIHDERAISYLLERGLSLETAERVGLGFDAEWISPTVCKRLEAEGKSWRPPTTERLIIPVTKGHYIARATDANIKEYVKMNEGNIDIFNFEAVNNNPVVFIVEGAIDAISIEEVGGCAIALNSTSNIQKFVDKLGALPEISTTFIVSMDNDEAGAKANTLLLEKLKEVKVNCMKKNIAGDYKDANEALTNEKESFGKVVKMAIDEAKKKLKSADDQDEPAENKSFSETMFDRFQSDLFKANPTGVEWFDNVMSGGINNGEIVLLIASPAIGKTTLCQQLGEGIAENGRKVVYINLEMTAPQMIAKSISRMTAEDTKMTTLEVMRGYEWSAGQAKTVKEKLEVYEKKIQPNFKYKPDDVTEQLESIMQYLRAEAEKAIAAGEEAPVVFIDYLHLIRAEGRDEREVIGVIMSALKKYAVEYKTVLFVISATGREAQKRKAVTMHDGRESSVLEYTAENILTLNYVEDEKGNLLIDSKGGKKYTRVILKVEKNRYGERKEENLYFYGKCGKFYDKVWVDCKEAPPASKRR